MLRVLLTGSGAPGWVPIYKCLTKYSNVKLQIFGCDIISKTAGSFYAKKHYKAPSGDSPDYIQAIEKIICKEKISTIIPLTDLELIPLSKEKNHFKNRFNTEVLVSSYDSIEKSLNKAYLLNELSKNNIPVPDYFVADSWDKFKSSIKKLGYPKSAVCLKPVIGWGSRGFRILNNYQDKLHAYLNDKPNSTFTTFENIEHVLKEADPFPEMLVMEYLPGKEYSVDLFSQNGKVQYVIPRLRLKMNNGITVAGVTERNAEIIKISKKISALYGLDYAHGIQFRYDTNNVPKVLEINPRLQGSSVLSMAAGINLAELMLNGGKDKLLTKRKIKWGTKMFRNWQEVFVDKNGKILFD